MNYVMAPGAHWHLFSIFLRFHGWYRNSIEMEEKDDEEEDESGNDEDDGNESKDDRGVVMKTKIKTMIVMIMLRT